MKQKKQNESSRGDSYKIVVLACAAFCMGAGKQLGPADSICSQALIEEVHEGGQARISLIEEEIAKMQRQGQDVHCVSENQGIFWLNYLVASHHVESVRHVLDQAKIWGLDLNFQNKSRISTLDPEMRRAFRTETPLISAVNSPYVFARDKITWLLLHHGADVNRVPEALGQTALIRSLDPASELRSDSESGAYRILFLLRLFGGDVNHIVSADPAYSIKIQKEYRNQNAVDRATKNRHFSSQGVRDVLDLLMRPQDVLTSAHAGKVFKDAPYLHQLLEKVDATDISSLPTFDQDLFCVHVWSYPENLEMNVFEWLETLLQRQQKSGIGDNSVVRFVRSVQQDLKQRQVSCGANGKSV